MWMHNKGAKQGKSGTGTGCDGEEGLKQNLRQGWDWVLFSHYRHLKKRLRG